MFVRLYKAASFSEIPEICEICEIRVRKPITNLLPITYYLQHVFWTLRLIRSILSLQQHRSTLQAFQAMPLASLYVQYNTPRHHVNRIHEVAILVIEILLKVSTNAYASLRCTLMSVYRHHRSWLQRI